MNVRFQKTPKGEMAILPRKDYEALVMKAAEADEDAGTARAVARARKEIAAGAPLLPKDAADRLADGENPVRVLREMAGHYPNAFVFQDSYQPEPYFRHRERTPYRHTGNATCYRNGTKGTSRSSG